MIILERIKESKFPEGRIVLLNGTELVCYNKVSQCNTNGTDTSGIEEKTPQPKEKMRVCQNAILRITMQKQGHVGTILLYCLSLKKVDS